MNKKKVLISGISGNIGSYLAERFLAAGYEVYGIIRRKSVTEEQSRNIDHLGDKVRTDYADITDLSSIQNLVRTVKPDIISHCAAMSHVRISFDTPISTMEINVLGTLNMLEACRMFAPNTKFHFQASSECFGNQVDIDNYQRETTRMLPVSPYGASKVCGFNIVTNYRNAYNLFAVNTICHNSESPRRSNNFVTQKIAKTAVEIKKGFRNKLELGNLDSHRDWLHSWDTAKGIFAALNYKIPDDFSISSMKTHSVRDFCNIVFNKLNMNYKDYVVQNERFIRPSELKYLRGDSSKLRNKTGWQPTYSFDDLVNEMVDYWLKKYE